MNLCCHEFGGPCIVGFNKMRKLLKERYLTTKNNIEYVN